MEVRWIFPGRLTAATERWFGRFPARTESREDTYLLDPQTVPRGQQRGHEPGCEVELTEIRTSGQDWWSLAFEATGRVSLLRSQLQATAVHVFAQTLPGGLQPGPDQSRSYPQWLHQQQGSDSDTGA